MANRPEGVVDDEFQGLAVTNNAKLFRHVISHVSHCSSRYRRADAIPSIGQRSIKLRQHSR